MNRSVKQIELVNLTNYKMTLIIIRHNKSIFIDWYMFKMKKRLSKWFFLSLKAFEKYDNVKIYCMKILVIQWNKMIFFHFGKYFDHHFWMWKYFFFFNFLDHCSKTTFTKPIFFFYHRLKHGMEFHCVNFKICENMNFLDQKMNIIKEKRKKNHLFSQLSHLVFIGL